MRRMVSVCLRTRHIYLAQISNCPSNVPIIHSMDNLCPILNFCKCSVCQLPKDKHLLVFAFNNEIHTNNTRNNNNFHFLSVQLTKVSKGPYITGIRLYNHLPQVIKTLDHNSRKFKTSLKRFFHQHLFYSMEEYFEYIDELP